MSDTPSGNSPILTTGIDTSGFLKGLKEMREANERFVAHLETLSTLASKTGIKTGQQLGEGIRNAILEYTKDTNKILSAMATNTQAAKAAGAKIGKAVGQGMEEAALGEASDLASRLTASVSQKVGKVRLNLSFRGNNPQDLLSAAQAQGSRLASEFPDPEAAEKLERRLAAVRATRLQALQSEKGIREGLYRLGQQEQKQLDDMSAFYRRQAVESARAMSASRAAAEEEERREKRLAAVRDTKLQALQGEQGIRSGLYGLGQQEQKQLDSLSAFYRKQSAESAKSLEDEERRERRLAAVRDTKLKSLQGEKGLRDGLYQLGQQEQKQLQEMSAFYRRQAREAEQALKAQAAAAKARIDTNDRFSGNVAEATFMDPTTSARTKLRMARTAQALLAAGAERADVETKYGSSALDANVDKLRRLAAAQQNSAGLMRQWTANAREAHSMARGLAGSLGVLWLTWGSTIPIAAGAAIGMSMRQIITAGKELEYQLRFVSELTDRTQVSFQTFFDAMGSSMTPPLEAAKGLRALAQSGLDTKQALAALKPTLDLAVVGELSVSEAAYAATGAMHAFNLGFGEISRVGDVFAKAAAISNTSVAGITESMKQASTVAEFYGITVEETGAALALLAKRNIEGSAAGTAFRNMMVELTTPSEKAKKAMAQLGLELYDNQNRLKDFRTIMTDLYGTLSQLDEKSRLAALNDIFNERGVKAAAAILGDFTTFEKLLREMGDAGGYTSQVLSGLSDTVQGQLQIAMSNMTKTFQMAFQEVQSGTKNIARDLADLAASEGFREMVRDLAVFTVDLTRALLDNKEVIGSVVAAWAGLKIVTSLTTTIWEAAKALGSASVAARMAGGSFTLASIAAGNLWRALLGPIGLIASLGIAYLTLRQNVNEGNEALRANNERMRDLIEETQRAVDSQRELNDQLIERNRLLSIGVNPDQIAPKDVVQAAEQFNQAAIKMNRLRAAKDAAPNDVNKNQEFLAAKAEFDRQKVVFEDLMARTNRLKEERLVGSQEESLRKDVELAKELNRQLEVRKERGEKKLPELIDTKSLPSLTDEARKRLIESVKQGLSTASYTSPTRGANREQRDLFNAQRKALTDNFNDQVRLQDMLYERELFSIDKQFQYREITEQEYSDRRMAASFDYLRQVSALEQEALLEINGLKEDADKKSQREQLKSAAERIRKANEERQLREKLDKDKRTEEAGYAFNEDMRAIGRRLPALEERALKDSRDKLANRDLALVSDVEAAGMEAATNATKAYTDVLSDLLKKKEEAIDRFGMESAQVAEAIWLENGLREEMVRVSEQARENGKELGRYYRTAEYGAKKAFTAYTQEASNAAAATERLLTNAFKGAEDALVNFVKTGKLDFRSLAESIISDLIRIQVQQTMLQAVGNGKGLLDFGMKIFSFMSGGPSSVVTAADMSAWNPTSAIGDLSWNANGNVFGPWGKIDAFAKGDLFDRATMFRHSGSRLGVLGEAGPEAIMPVDRDSNGRLGVKVVGRQGGSGGVVVNQSVNITVQGSADDPQKLAAVVSSMVKRQTEQTVSEVLMREKRSGGMLA